MRIVYTVLCLGLLAGLAPGQVVSYEATSFPDDATPAWERETFCTPERSLVGGVLVMDVEIGECGPPPGGDSDIYRRDLDDFEGDPTFFVEFRSMTDGDRSEIIGQSPLALTAGSFGELTYGWTIARDQVKLFRDALLPILFFDIAPDVFHTYRLELRDTTSYAWFIDGVVVDSGIPEGAYPSVFPVLGWRAKVSEMDSTSEIDYVRYGVIPIDGSGDFDSDGQVDENDQYFFEECVDNSGENVDAGPGCRWADFDADTDVDCDDWDAFDAAWTGAGNPTVPAACFVPPIPAVSTWGMMVTLLTLLSCGTIIIRRIEWRACPRR
ncbi:MAG: hypothetical protein IH987_03155 [Planctomycetes bacterium]|nr:hypothetical protein [Planctomycetota bacterium]